MWAEKGGEIMISNEQIAHDLAVAITQVYIADAAKSGEYQKDGISDAAMDALNVYKRAFSSILNAK